MANPGNGYEWTQSKEELTLSVPLPVGHSARDVQVSVKNGEVSIAVVESAGNRSVSQLVRGLLWDGIIGSVWSVESQLLTLELEKSRQKWWPCALRGDAEVDVAALVAKEKRDNEPAYKPPPDADSQPRQVTDRETLRKLKAEFPNLALPVENEHTATHQNFAGPRKTFDWGALPVDDEAPAAAPCAVPAVPAVARASGVVAVPSATATPSAARIEDAKFLWGEHVPLDSTGAAVNASAASSAGDVDQGGGSGAGGGGMYQWGALPTDARRASPFAPQVTAPQAPPAPPAAGGSDDFLVPTRLGNASAKVAQLAAMRKQQPTSPPQLAAAAAATKPSAPSAPSTTSTSDASEGRVSCNGESPVGMYSWGALPIQ